MRRVIKEDRGINNRGGSGEKDERQKGFKESTDLTAKWTKGPLKDCRRRVSGNITRLRQMSDDGPSAKTPMAS